MNTKILLSILFSLILLATLAESKQLPSAPGSNLIINTWQVDYIKQNTDYSVAWSVIDVNGIPQNNTQVNCSYYFAPVGTVNQGIFGVGNRSADPRSWFFTIPAKKLNVTGMYNYQISCISSLNSSVYGTVLNVVEVNPTGDAFTLEQTFLYIAALAVLLLWLILFVYGSMLFNITGVKIFSLSLAVITLISMTAIISSNATSYLYQFNNIAGVYSNYYIVMAILSGAGLVGVIVWLIYFVLTRWSKMRGRSEDED